jgi:uncharacterized repeat protein (TIGR01451 family)
MNRSVLLGSVLILVLVSLTIVLGTMPTWAAEEVSIVHTTLEDFNTGFLYHTGLTRFDDGEVQLLVVGLAGDWITDTNTTGLPALARHTAVYTHENIIVLGGVDIGNMPSNKVYYSTIDLYTHDLADWQQTTALPASVYPNGGVYWHSSAMAHDRVYVLGGRDNSGAVYDTVTFAPINANGTLGAWQSSTVLPQGLCQAKAVAVGGRIYVIGGQLVSGYPVDTIYMGTPNSATGLIDSWTTLATPFVHRTFGHMAAVHEDKIYVMGGWHPTEGVSPYTHVATVDPTTGELGTWTALTDMNHNIFGAAGLAFNGVLFTTGGALNNFTSPSDYVGTNLIELDGTIGQWANTSTVDPARFYHATVNSNDGWLYVINGSDGTNALQSINRGATSGVGQQYAPDGTFTSSAMDLGTISKLVRMEWNTTIPDTSIMEVTMEYRTKLDEVSAWSAWRGPYPSSSVPGTVTTTQLLEGNARFIQYRVYLATDDTQQTPALNTLRLTYELPSYEVNVTKNAVPAPNSVVHPGDVISYSLIYSNGITGITATRAIVVDLPPEFTSYIPGTIFGPGADASNPEELHWSLGTLDPGETGELGFSVLVDPGISEPTVLENMASIDSDQGPPAPSNIVRHFVEVFYEAQIGKDAVPPPRSEVRPGDYITYTLTYTNSGVRDLTQGTITETYDATGGYNVLVNKIVPPPDEGNNIWHVPQILVGDSDQIEIVVQVSSAEMPNHWPISNEASLTTAEAAIATTPLITHTVILPPAPRVDLVVQGLTWEPKRIIAGSAISFRAVIANQGTLAAGRTFWAELYVKPWPSSPPTGPSDHDYGFCLENCTVLRHGHAQDIASLGAGATALADFESCLAGTYALPPGKYDVYVQVDTAYGFPDENPYWGMFAEEWESNNLYRTTVTIEPGGAYLPMVFKRHW